MLINTPRTRATFLVLLLDEGLPQWAQVYIKGTEARPMQRRTVQRGEHETCSAYWRRVLDYAEALAWRAEPHQPGESMGSVDLSVRLRQGDTDAEHDARCRAVFEERRRSAWAARKVARLKAEAVA